MRVVIVGRTNAGKSTIFNKITEKKQAIISPQAGTTRDINKQTVSWRGRDFTLYDTAGIDIKPRDAIETETKKESLKILDKADIFILVIDGQTGLLPQDKEIAQLIRSKNKPTILVINKIDNPRLRQKIDWGEITTLGFAETLPVSAVTGAGLGDLLDKIISFAPKQSKKTLLETQPFIKISFLGKPNVGKSSLLNALLKLYAPQEDKIIVTSLPYTTRDKQPRFINFQGQTIEIIDTPGVRRKAKINSRRSLERLSVRESIRTMQEADIIIFVLDVSAPLTQQDKKLAGLLKNNYKSLLIAVNKWDLLQEKDTHTEKEFSQYLESVFPFLKDIPIIFLSAKTGKNVSKIIPLLQKIYAEQNKKIPDKKLEKFLKRIIKKQPPVQAKGPEKPYISKIQQTDIAPPTFAVTIRKQDSLHFSYLRFIENELRDKFGFMGANIKIVINKTK